MTLNELKRFCGKNQTLREWMNEPFSDDEWTYATDNSIIVRAPKFRSITAKAPVNYVKKIQSWFMKPVSRWVSVPVVKKRKIFRCECCRGSGKRGGEVCGLCNGDGFVITQIIPVAIGEYSFADHYLWMIEGWKISPAERAAIRGNGATGFLMSMGKE